MKFTCSVDIDLPRNRVVELWENDENLKEWQDGFISYEHQSGDPGKPGAQSKFLYKMGKKGQMELLETIEVNDLPEEFTARYEAASMVNTMKNHFIELDENKTRWETHIDYIEFRGFAIRLMARLMPGVFKKQVQKWLNQFKAFAENATAG